MGHSINCLARMHNKNGGFLYFFRYVDWCCEWLSNFFITYTKRF